MKQLVHGGDWMGYRERFGRDALDFSANVSPLGLPEGVAQAIRDELPAWSVNAFALAAAQAIRERMADCDAALRSLPAQIERACAPETAAPWLADILDGAQARSALFLPLRRVRVPSVVTHPHGFLALPDKAKTPDDAWAFLMFCDALCAHPFYPLFWRSPVAAPYRSRVTLGF